MNKYLKYILLLIGVTGISFALHYLVLKNQQVEKYWLDSGYSLIGLYTFGVVASFFVSGIVLVSQWAMPKNLGFIFLGVITIKVVASYLYIQSGLNLFANDFIELNFLIVFFIFLFFDVFVAFKAINEDEGK